MLFLSAGQVGTAAISFAVTVLLARHLGAQDYGVLFLATTLVQSALVLADFGQEYYLVGRIARDRSSAAVLLGTGGALRLVLAAATYPLLAVLAAVLDYPEATRMAIALTVLALLVGSIGDGIHLVLRGLERMDLEAALRVVSKLLIGVATLLAVFEGGGLRAVLVMQIVGAGAAVPIYFLVLQRLALARPQLSLSTARAVVAGGAPFLLWAIVLNLHPSIGALLLSALAPPSVIGWFAAASRLIGLLIFPATLVGAALYPALARLHVQDPARYAALVQAALRATVLLGVLAAAGTYLFADAAVALVYGADAFAPAAGNLQMLAAYMPILFVDITLGAAIMAAGAQRPWILAKLASLVVFGGAGLGLIPLFQAAHGNGGLGCAAATAVSELVMFAAALALVPVPKRRLGVALAVDLGRGAAAALGMAAAASLLRQAAPLAGMAVAVITYFAFIYLLGAIRREDIRFIGEVVRPGSRV